ncbi:hypothetical protein JVU11DRAFT_7900 [Chiua virens]|nr:hypothetical protein JVU11DRAFT_7900 [Chiua virens]
MSDDDAAYSALLAQLLSDSTTSRNARVHSWIEHQYDFALSEHSPSRPPSPSPSSSLGAHRTFSVDRPDSPLLPRFSSDRPSSPCPSYDALFFPPPTSKPDDNDFEEQERLRALRFIVQEMALWKSQATHSSPRLACDKPLPAPPPSPASSLTQSTSSRVVRSRSSSTCISRLPSFTSTLASDQSQPREILPPLPVSVIVHGEYQHDLVLRHERPIVDPFLHRRDDSFSRPLLYSQEQEVQLLSPIYDDKDSIQPSPTLSSFSCTHSRETSFTTPLPSSPASPCSVAFYSPENIALPASPAEDSVFAREPVLHERAHSYQTSSQTKPAFPLSPSVASSTLSLPKTNVFPASPISTSFPVAIGSGADLVSQHLRAPKQPEHSQSRWSVATTASVTQSNAEPKSGLPVNSRSQKKDKVLKTPKKRARFISLISRLSPGRGDTSSTTTTSQPGDDADYDSVNDSDIEDKYPSKPRKSLSKKSSLASLRASFSISRASFSSQRPSLASPTEEVPPLPMSPTLTSPLVDSVPKLLQLSRGPPFREYHQGQYFLNTPLPPIPQSACSVTSFRSSSQVSISGPGTPLNMSRVSLLPALGKRTSLASAAGIEPMVSRKPPLPGQPATRSKSIFRLTAKPKSLKTPTPLTPVSKIIMPPSRLPVAGHVSLSSPTTARSKIPQAPAKFNPPAKLATVIATQTRQPAMHVGPGLTSTSKLSMPPSRIPPKAPRTITPLEKAESLSSLPPSSRLPMPAPTKGTRVGTVKGFWKRQ